MAWLSISLHTDDRHAEALADAFLAHGALSASIEDADAGTADETPQFGEPGSPTHPGWQHSRVVALLPADARAVDLVADCARSAGLATTPEFSEEWIAEQDWVQLTQSQFEPIRIADRLWIVPSWHQVPEPPAVALVLDPGMAFGTGSHATTRLCLEWLERTPLAGKSLLDYGCGSGILAIAAAKLGARQGQVWGIDIDPQAVSASRDNAERNTVEVTFLDAAHPLTGTFDVVIANILANPLRVLAPALCGYLNPGGTLVLSGILVDQAAELIAIYAPWLSLSVVDSRDGWVCLAGNRT
ncbi:MAG TPA: 50S ribosomal protein L11 methyltransferase [Accumulibacter sp.]|nr:50S ribosomal protein L11 methyltransferase [Accumulibacter sp.]HMW16762.1 50S ribosomal protein L11 methyltransferase [Accumulibacter sp.]HMX23579.1 50S ribosomal protein L11 methyltransferase [Accumulibacter sp.]HMY06850.1 50S ribosomal protein L11 methyltransferase [Accumulibacter sp.]HNC17871.1 50S ribosomal protein L11 methyltransferase [Accumulibacter sp.]